MLIRFRWGRIYDPVQGLDRVIQDLFAQNGVMIAAPAASVK
ncbi:hypothetical protein [Methylobacter marinus]|nr:hypothetical protein [Methylobacter marinus]